MRHPTLINGALVDRGGYWGDGHGHQVYVCAGQVLPACPQFPFDITFWQLSAEVACGHPQHAGGEPND